MLFKGIAEVVGIIKATGGGNFRYGGVEMAEERFGFFYAQQSQIAYGGHACYFFKVVNKPRNGYTCVRGDTFK